MRTIITFVLVIVVLNAAIRGGSAYWKYYQFRDATEQMAVFGGRTATNLLHEQVFDKATKMDVPIASDGIEVTREGGRTVIDAKYEQPVELFPRYTRVLKFAFSVSGELQ